MPSRIQRKRTINNSGKRFLYIIGWLMVALCVGDMAEAGYFFIKNDPEKVFFLSGVGVVLFFFSSVIFLIFELR